MNIEHRTSNIEHRNAGEARRSEGRAYDLEERLLEFGARMVRLVAKLPRSRASRHLGEQLVRSGTSPLVNHGEAQAAESSHDFIHKLRLCLKELRETQRTLRPIHRVPLVEPPSKLDDLLGETDELIRIFVASVRTAEQNEKRDRSAQS